MARYLFLFVTLLLAVLTLALAGCDATSNAAEPEYVVQAYLIADEPLPPVRVFQPAPMGASFDSTAAAVRGAEVVIYRLDDDGQVAASHAYVEDRPGVYRPAAGEDRVVPGATYRLEVHPPGGDSPIRATTAVPETFEVVAVENPEVVYQGPSQSAVTITPSNASERQNVYVFTLTSLLDFEHTPEAELWAEVTPFLADVLDPDEDDIYDLRVSASPLFNEAYYDVNADGTLTIELPWIAVAFYGANRVGINLLDENLYDLLRTQEAQQGGLSPGEIPHILDHVEGGTGIFGSYARQQFEVHVTRPDAGGPE